MGVNIRVMVWNEGLHERNNAAVRAIYPEGLGRQIARGLEGRAEIAGVRVAELGDPEQGLSAEALAETDVLIWWGHLAHDAVEDAAVERVHNRVLDGMGLIVLHSGHYSKIFKRLMGTRCDLKWRHWQERGERERLWVVDPAHPIVAGLPECIELEYTEMYGEPFGIPQPDQLVFISWFAGGEVFRSGCCWHRGQGKVFYFRPGHETIPIYFNSQIQRVIQNAVCWAAPVRLAGEIQRNMVAPREPLDAFRPE